MAQKRKLPEAIESGDARRHPCQNVALFGDVLDPEFLMQAIRPWSDRGRVCLMTADATLFPAFSPEDRLPYIGALPDRPEVGSNSVIADFERLAEGMPGLVCIIVDMAWALNTIWAASLLERWGAIAQAFGERTGIALVSLYNREILVEDQFASALRVHQWVAAPSGCYRNPHWLPHTLVSTGTLQAQLNFLLGQFVPEFAEKSFHRASVQDYARGATPAWAQRKRRGLTRQPSNRRWHIHCLGPLRIYVGGQEEVDWNIPGSAPKKTRALFAYLLNRGETGANVDRLCEFLWSDNSSEETKRGRLRHTLAMLRKSLGGPETVERIGDQFRLNVPEDSWTDIRAFEQLCRRGLALFRQGDLAGAIRVYEGAERLYGGDLFEDIDINYVECEFDDWCKPRRIWLHEMAVKLQYDMSKVLRGLGRSREALHHAQRALQLDPLNDFANIEVMLSLAEQGRIDAVSRQYQQYLKAVVTGGDAEPSDEVYATFRELVPKSVSTAKRMPNAR